MSVSLSYFAGAGWQFFSNTGVPLSGGLLYTYLAGTSTPAATYNSNSGSVQNSNPIQLDATGRIPDEIWTTQGGSYKFILKDANNVLIGSWDNIQGINDFSSIYADLANTTDISKGDALIGFKQANSVSVYAGAVGKTVHDKLTELVSVKDFGAKGDGTNDDTVAIQAALNSGAGVILFPYGVYKIAGGSAPTATTLIVPSTVSELRGEGGFRGPSELNFTGTNTTGNALDIQSTNIRNISNLYLNTSTNGCFTNIIKIADNTHFCNWTNVSTNGGATTHWSFGSSCFDQCFINCSAWGTDWAGQTGIKLPYASNAFDFHSCHFVHCGIGIWLIDYLENFNYFGGEIASNVRYGLYIGSDSGTTNGIENVNLYGVYFEDNPTHIFQNCIDQKGLFIRNCRTSETSWSNFVLINNNTYSVNIDGGTFLRLAGTAGILLNINNKFVVNAFITGPYLYNVTAYSNQGNQQVWYRTNNIGGSPGQISYETMGIEAQKDFNTSSSFASKKLFTYLGNGINPVTHDVSYGSVYDSVVPGGSGSLWTGYTFPQGSLCWNSSAAVGQPKGWMCTVAGTPGTWVSMGNL